jgi:O-antigen ligase
VARNILKQYTVLTYFKFIIFASGVIQSIIAIAQFTVQKSIGLTWLGESVVGKNIHNVAKFSFEGEKYIRAYGTFPHPNVLGIFLLFTLSAGLSLFLAKKNILKNVRWPYRFIFYIEIFVVLLGLILTYSRTTLVLTTIILGVFIFRQRRLINRSYKKYCERFRVPFFLQTTLAILFIFGTIFASYNILAPRLCLQCAGGHSWELRKVYQKNAEIIIFRHPLIGVGLGNFISTSKNITDYSKFPWRLQPVHNLYLLIASEIGLLGLFLFLLTIFFYFFKRISFYSILNSPLDLFFMAVLLISFFDHYFWTLRQGQLIFWLTFALASIPKTKKVDSPKYHFDIILKNIRQLIKELS